MAQKSIVGPLTVAGRLFSYRAPLFRPSLYQLFASRESSLAARGEEADNSAGVPVVLPESWSGQSYHGQSIPKGVPNSVPKDEIRVSLAPKGSSDTALQLVFGGQRATLTFRSGDVYAVDR